MKTGKQEWSGPLIYRTLGGDIDNPNSLKMRAEGVFLMDVGTAGGTDFEMTGMDTVALYDTFPDLDTGDARLGLIHTHHDMRVYFSGVDNSELKDNAEDYNAYLSLIVGFNMKPVARVAFVAEVEKTTVKKYNYKNMRNDDKIDGTQQTEKEKVVFYYDCDVLVEFDAVNDDFIERYDTVKKRIEEEKKKNKFNKGGNSHYYGNQSVIGYGNNNPTNKQTNADKESNKSVTKPPNEYKYSDEEVERFLCKVTSYNPHTTTKNLLGVLKTMDRQKVTLVYLTPTNVINIIDECISQVFSPTEENSMTMNDKIDLFDEAAEYLELSDSGNKPLCELYDSAEAVRQSLRDIIEQLTEDEEEDNASIRF